MTLYAAFPIICCTYYHTITLVAPWTDHHVCKRWNQSHSLFRLRCSTILHWCPHYTSKHSCSGYILSYWLSWRWRAQKWRLYIKTVENWVMCWFARNVLKLVSNHHIEVAHNGLSTFVTERGFHVLFFVFRCLRQYQTSTRVKTSRRQLHGYVELSTVVVKGTPTMEMTVTWRWLPNQYQ